MDDSSDSNIPDGLSENAKLIYEEGDFKVFAEELSIMWKWDLYRGDHYLHTGSAQRIESCIVSAKTRIGFFRRKDVSSVMKDTSF